MFGRRTRGCEHQLSTVGGGVLAWSTRGPQLSIIGGGVLVREKDIHQHTLRSSLLLGRSSAKLKGGAMVFGSIFGLATSSPPEGGGEAGASPPPSGGEDNFGEGPPSGGQPPSSFREGALSPQERGSGDSGSTPRWTAAVSPRAASSQQLETCERSARQPPGAADSGAAHGCQAGDGASRLGGGVLRPVVASAPRPDGARPATSRLRAAPGRRTTNGRRTTAPGRRPDGARPRGVLFHYQKVR